MWKWAMGCALDWANDSTQVPFPSLFFVMFRAELMSFVVLAQLRYSMGPPIFGRVVDGPGFARRQVECYRGGFEWEVFRRGEVGG